MVVWDVSHQFQVCSEWEAQVQLLTLSRSGALELLLSEEHCCHPGRLFWEERLALLLPGYPGGDGLQVAQELSQLSGWAEGSLVPVTGTVPQPEWVSVNGEHGRVDGSGQHLMACSKRRDTQLQTVPDLCQNSDQGFAHLGDQISFTSRFCFKK